MKSLVESFFALIFEHALRKKRQLVQFSCENSMMSKKEDLGVWFPAVRAGTGADVFTENLVSELVKRGIRAEVAWLPPRAEYAPWSVSVPPPPAWATVAHVNTWLHPRFLPKTLPVVATIHHSVHNPDLKPYKGLLRALYHRYWIAPSERRVMRRSKCVVAVSRFVAEIAKKELLDVPMELIYNGVDTNRYRPGLRLRAQGKPFRLLYVGAWRGMKGIDLLQPIMRTLNNGFELRYTGLEPGRVQGNMRDIGYLDGSDKVVKAMQEADAFLFPSRSEGFGLVAAEAMACGLPVIATNLPSIAEIVENGVTGVLCPMDDVAAFVKAAHTLREGRMLWECMSKTGREHVVNALSQSAVVCNYLKVYSGC